jgi:O-antigen ligase
VFSAVRRREHFVWIVAAFVTGAALSAAYSVVHPPTAGRLTGTIGDPNEEAAALVAALMLAGGLFMALPRSSRRRWWTVTGGVVILAGFLSTVSRGGLVALAVTLLAGTVFGGRWRRQALLLTVAGAAAVVLYLATFASVSALQHVNSTNSTGRTDIWTVGWRMLQSHPLTGVGSGNFPKSAVHYVQQPGQITRADLIVDVPHATHNTYLQIADELGVPGLIAFLAICAASLAAALKAARAYEHAGDTAFGVLSRVLFLAILGVLAADFFISGEDSKQLWLLLALPAPLLALARSSSDLLA